MKWRVAGRDGRGRIGTRGREAGGVAWWLVTVLVTGTCARTVKRPPPSLLDIDTGVQGDPRAVMQKEVIAELLESYVRDEPPEHGLSMLGVVDAARIGVGPGDVLVGAELDRAPSRWPLLVTEGVMARSKAPLVQLSADASAAWVADEISWRVTLCNRVSVVPLRYTALYGRDADRWVLVVEHLSYGNEPSAELDGTPRGRTMTGATISRGLADALSRELAPLWQGATPPHLDTSGAAIALGPRWGEERRGRAVAGWTLQDLPLQVESRRIGVVGRDVERATVASRLHT